MDSIQETTNAIVGGRQTAEQVVSATFDRIEAVDAKVRAFLSHDRQRSLGRARQVDAAIARGEAPGPLAGVPIALKDNICTCFGTTTCGSKILAEFRSLFDATVVERLEAAGAILVGKTNLDEFAMGSSTEHGAMGATHNPWDLSCVAGGSSGGSAAAVAAGMVPGSLGSETGGSVRLPAGFCGVTGLKPTYGRVSRYGLVAFGSSLDQIGPCGRSVADVASLLKVIAGHDVRDSTCVDRPVPDYVAALERPLDGLRIGISSEYFGEGLEESVRGCVEEAIELLKGQGATVTSIDLPHMRYGVACYYIIATAEASSNLARFDGVHYGHRTEKPEDVYDLYASSRGEGFGSEVKRRIMLGTYVLSSGYYDAYYLKALKVRTLIKQDFDRAFSSVDVIASPVAPTTAFAAGEKLEDPLAMYLMDAYTLSANLAGICAISVPCGFDDGGMPIGFQLMGPAFGEETILSATHQYQLRTDYHLKSPTAVPAN
jgi:aspartyl-tRNA(Asn)/glutamyl-tRNA(Gln) amidotransferase subunit A